MWAQLGGPKVRRCKLAAGRASVCGGDGPQIAPAALSAHRRQRIRAPSKGTTTPSNCGTRRASSRPRAAPTALTPRIHSCATRRSADACASFPDERARRRGAGSTRSFCSNDVRTLQHRGCKMQSQFRKNDGSFSRTCCLGGRRHCESQEWLDGKGLHGFN